MQAHCHYDIAEQVAVAHTGRVVEDYGGRYGLVLGKVVGLVEPVEADIAVVTEIELGLVP